MKFRNILLATMFAALLIPAVCPAESPSLVVRVAGADPATGNVEVSVFNSEDTFMKKTYAQHTGPVSEDGTWSTVFASLPEGDYAVVVVHDANNNQKLDNGLFGFGGESYAFSNEAWSLFGRPGFEDAKISVTEPVEVLIELN